MPFYQYFCEENNRTIEVKHAMFERLKTWGEVCERAEIDPGETPLNAGIVRMISKPSVVSWKVKGLDKDAPSDKLSL